MSDKMYDLRDMLCDELDKVTDKGVVTRDALEVIDKLTHSIKSIDTILAMEDAGYSNDNYSNDYSNARGRGRNAKRDSMGRYSSRRDGRYYNDNRGYSGHDMMTTLEDMLDNATDSRERETIQKMMEHYR